jgi:hypothetical protein
MPPTVPMALTRQRVVLQITRAEMMLIESRAREAGVSVANYFRSLAGLPPLSAGRPTRAQMEEEQDRACGNFSRGRGSIRRRTSPLTSPGSTSTSDGCHVSGLGALYAQVTEL